MTAYASETINSGRIEHLRKVVEEIMQHASNCPSFKNIGMEFLPYRLSFRLYCTNCAVQTWEIDSMALRYIGVEIEDFMKELNEHCLKFASSKKKEVKPSIVEEVTVCEVDTISSLEL